jgi:hypothetical protein
MFNNKRTHAQRMRAGGGQHRRITSVMRVAARRPATHSSGVVGPPRARLRIRVDYLVPRRAVDVDQRQAARAQRGRNVGQSEVQRAHDVVCGSKGGCARSATQHQEARRFWRRAVHAPKKPTSICRSTKGGKMASAKHGKTYREGARTLRTQPATRLRFAHVVVRQHDGHGQALRALALRLPLELGGQLIRDAAAQGRRQQRVAEIATVCIAQRGCVSGTRRRECSGIMRDVRRR